MAGPALAETLGRCCTFNVGCDEVDPELAEPRNVRPTPSTSWFGAENHTCRQGGGAIEPIKLVGVAASRIALDGACSTAGKLESIRSYINTCREYDGEKLSSTYCQ